MKAAVLHQLNQPLVVEELTVPEPAAGQVLVRVSYSGICHSQLLEIQGKRGKDDFLPHCMGHEGSGVVEEVGPGVTRAAPGDHVILSWIKAKTGMNVTSVSYDCGKQKVNAGAITTFNSAVLASENRVTRISKEMPLDKAALIGCAFSTGAGAVFHNARLKPGHTIAIFGSGGIGLNAIQAARIENAGMVIAVDISDQNLERARSFGATHTINAKLDHPVQTIRKLTGGSGTDASVEAIGKKETMEQSFESVRRGGIAILVGNLPFQEKISIDPFELICGKRIVGSWGGETDPDRDFPRYVDLCLSGKLDLDKMITHRIKLEEVNQAFEWMLKGEVGRSVIEF